jgi:hypothetical protein
MDLSKLDVEYNVNGVATRVFSQIGWAKLRALRDDAAIASKKETRERREAAALRDGSE